MKPATKYTKSGSINIAYQVFGSGPIDLVYIPGWISNIDLMWSNKELVDFLLELGQLAKVILFDKRGTGLSDRIVEFSTLEERMDDIRAVMDAAGSEKAVLFGHSEGGSVSALFSATYPERTLALIAFGIFAKRRYHKDYPWAPTDAERQVTYDMIENNWGSGEMNLESLAPSKARDKEFMEWLSDYFRSGASPSAAMVLTKMNTQVDIVDILGSIMVPTLIMQRTHDIDVKIEEGRFIADRIPNAKFVELDGNDHLFWVGDTGRVLEEIKHFIKALNTNYFYEERLFTIVAGKVQLEPLDPRLLSMIRDHITKAGAENFFSTDNTFISTFDGPTKAVSASLDLVRFLISLNVQILFAVDMKVGSFKENQVIKITDQKEITEIFNASDSNGVFLTQAVKYLLSGVDLQFKLRGQIHSSKLRKISFYEVMDNEDFNHNLEGEKYSKSSSFLEAVLTIVERNFSSDSFGVDELCREVGVSERQLQRKLKALTNKSPIQLILSVKLHHARKVLLSGDRNISEVAYQSGFNDPSYFAKCFKKEFGLSPSSLPTQ